MKSSREFAAVILTSLAFAGTVSAAPLTISTGVSTECVVNGVVQASKVPCIFNGIVDLLLLWSSLVATSLFLLGSALMVGSGGNDAILSNGKKIMKASLIGLAIILSSWLIISTVVSFIA